MEDSLTIYIVLNLQGPSHTKKWTVYIVTPSVIKNISTHQVHLNPFEVCGIAEHIGIEIPPGGAIRRCALRRWALDTKRGGALPVARLMDFVDNAAGRQQMERCNEGIKLANDPV